MVPRCRWKASDQRKIIAYAMSAYHNNTCIRFVPRTCEKSYITISKTGNGCVSFPILKRPKYFNLFVIVILITGLILSQTTKLLELRWHARHFSPTSKSRWWMSHQSEARSSHARTNAHRWILPRTHASRSWHLREDQLYQHSAT
jgi:hypothetical protein